MHARDLAIILIVLGAASGAHGASPAERCAAAKVKAAGRKLYAKTRCHQRALTAGRSVDAACLTAAELKFTLAFGRAESAGGCAITGDADEIEAAVDGCVATFLGAIAGTAKCAAAKIKAVGAKTYAKAKCLQKALLRGATTSDPTCLATAESRFEAAIAKADRRGTCTDSAIALESLVDECVPTLSGSPSGTGQTQPGLPIAVPSCAFASTCCDDACMPSFTLAGIGSNAGWTGFFSSADATTIRAYLDHPPTCNAAGTASIIPTVTVGDLITLTNGVTGAGSANPFALVQCLFDNAIDDRTFVVPVVDTESGACPGTFTSSDVVTGFITVVLDSVTTGALPAIQFHAVVRPGVPAQPGTSSCP